MALLPHHLALKVKNMRRCSQFYGRFLGLKEIKRHFYPSGKLRSIWYEIGNLILMVEVFEGREKPKLENTGWHLLAFKIKPRDRLSWIKRLKAKKIKIENATDYTLYFFDPEGNRIALSHY